MEPWFKFHAQHVTLGRGALSVLRYDSRLMCGGCSNHPCNSVSRTVHLLTVMIGRLDLLINGYDTTVLAVRQSESRGKFRNREGSLRPISRQMPRRICATSIPDFPLPNIFE